MPRPRLNITELTLILRPTLHPTIVAPTARRTADQHLLCSAGS